MHETPLKRSVTAPDISAPYPGSPVPSIIVTANALESFTPEHLSRHRTASPYPQSRLHSPDSPRPSDLLSHKDIVLGRSQPRSPMSKSSASSAQSKKSSNPESSVPCPDSEKSSTLLSRVYESTNSSLKSSILSSKNPSIIVSKAPLPNYHSNASSQSCLSVNTQNEIPPSYEMDMSESEDFGKSQLTTSRNLSFTGSGYSQKRSSHLIRKKFPSYVAAEAHRLSRSDPGASPRFQSPILRDSALSINLGDLERKLVIGDPDPSFHRSINSPITDQPDEVVLKQVGSFRVHHLRNDSLGKLPRISTVEELSSSPLPSSPEICSPKRGLHSPASPEFSSNAASPLSRLNIRPPKSINTQAIVALEETTSSTIFLPGEYGRRQHSRAGSRSRGNKNISVPLQISTQTELKPEITIGARVTPEGPPATPESPFTPTSREQTKLKVTSQNSPSPLIAFLSVIKSEVRDGSRKPLPPGEDNPSWILPAPPLGTTAVCFVQAYGNLLYCLQQNLRPVHGDRPSSLGSMITDYETTLALSTIPSHVDSVNMHNSLGSIITDNQAPITALPPHMRLGHMAVESPSFQSVQRILERNDRGLLSSQ